MPTTAGEQKVIDTWDLTSLDGAWHLLFTLNISGTVSDLVNSRLSTYELFHRRMTLIIDILIVLEYVYRLPSWDKVDSLPSGVQWCINHNNAHLHNN